MAVPAAIVVAGLIVAGAVFLSGGRAAAPAGQAGQAAPSGDPKAVAAVTAADHIIGDINAPVKLVEYSDIDCPFCQRVHPTLAQLKKDYGDKVAWVYRQNPLSIHPNAETKAVAAECVAKLAGNEAFWKFLDAAVADPAPGRTDLTRIPTLAAQAGVKDAAAFKSCWDNKDTLPVIKASMANMAATGGRGTPWTIVVGKNGATPVSGAQPIDAFKTAIDAALK